MVPVESTGLAGLAALDVGSEAAGLESVVAVSLEHVAAGLESGHGPLAGAIASAGIVVLYVREATDEGGELEEQVRRVVARYPAVELRVVGPEVAAGLWSASAYRSPSVLILRGGVVVGGAMGDRLPQRELVEMLHAAVSWPV
jgi:hypothetical protein